MFSDWMAKEVKMETVNMHLMCSICLETFKDPKALPCLHNFCQKCLQEHICKINASESGKSDYFECPLCRKKTYPVNHETKRECWAAEFLTNHFIVSIIDESKEVPKKVSISERQNPACIPCELDGKEEVSSCYCLSCCEYLCRSCQKDHKRFKMTRNHQVIDEGQYPDNTEIFKDISCLIQCKEHSDHDVQFKCLVHKTFICTICASTVHKECEPVLNIDDLNQDDISLDLDINKTRLESLKESLNAVITSKLAEAEILDNNIKLIVSNIAALQEALQHMIKFLQCDVLNEYSEKTQVETRKISSEVVQCIAAIEALHMANSFIETIQQNNLTKQQVVYMEVLHDKVEQIKQNVKELTSTQAFDASCLIKDRIYALKTMISDWFDKLDSFELKVEDQGTDTNQQDLSSDMSHTTNIQTHTVSGNDIDNENLANKATLMTPTAYDGCVSSLCMPTCSTHKLSDVDISIPGGSSKVSSHTGCVLLKNGDVIFLDRTNRIVKMMDSKLRYKCHVTLKHGPVDVLKINTDRIAVATPYSVPVFVVSGSKLQMVSDFLFKYIHVLLSICDYGDDFAILQTYSNERTRNFIQVRTTGNKIVRDVTSFTDVSSKPIQFRKPSLIRSTPAKHFVICDDTKVRKIDRHGKCIQTFTQDNLKSASYCVLDPMDNIFLCDSIGGNIFLVPVDMSSKAEVLVQGLIHVAAIEFDAVKKQLIVCFLHNNSVSVYQLS